MANGTMADGDELVPVTVLTGPLGAGKTTLLRRWLEGIPRGEAAVVVNEFAEVGVDGELLAGHVDALVERTGGCVGCTTQAHLVRALLGLAARRPRPRRVFVETSGAASPGSVVRAITRGAVARSLRLDGGAAEVDPTRVARVARALLFHEQVAFADVVVLTRAEASSPDERARVEAELRARNPAAVFAHASRGAVVSEGHGTFDDLLARRGDDLAAPWVLVRPPGELHGDPLAAVSLLHDGALDSDRFADWIEDVVQRAGPRLVRVKGVVALEGVPVRVVIQGVGGAAEVSFGRPWGDEAPRSRAVFLGVELDATALRGGFEACAATHEDPPSASVDT